MLKPPKNPDRTIRSFVLRASHATSGQRRALEELWPLYGLETKETLDFTEIFNNNKPVVLEIGFGNGEALAKLASNHPNLNFLGIEVHRPGIGHLLHLLHQQELKNARIICADAVDILATQIPNESLHTVNVFFPDPWHKKRHHKRRLIQTEFVTLLEKTLMNNGIFHLATDWAHYAEHAKAVLQQHPNFQFTDLDATFARPTTKFEQRGIKLGHDVVDLVYKKTNNR